jgi:Na+/proline symporter
VIAVVAATPYIALQLQSVVLAFGVFCQRHARRVDRPGCQPDGVLGGGGAGAFHHLFGTRNLDAKEQHHGIVTAIAVEAVVKLVALVAVGCFVVWGIAGGLSDIFARIDDRGDLTAWQVQPGRWTGLILLSAARSHHLAADVSGHGGREQ